CHHALGIAGRNIHKAEGIVDINGTDGSTRDIGFIGDGANKVLRSYPHVMTDVDEQSGHTCFSGTAATSRFTRPTFRAISTAIIALTILLALATEVGERIVSLGIERSTPGFLGIESQHGRRKLLQINLVTKILDRTQVRFVASF